MTKTALRGAGQTWWQIPQPVQTSGTTWGRLPVKRMAPSTGQRSLQVVQVVP